MKDISVYGSISSWRESQLWTSALSNSTRSIENVKVGDFNSEAIDIRHLLKRLIIEFPTQAFVVIAGSRELPQVSH
jgi:hypothetical protein